MTRTLFAALSLAVAFTCPLNANTILTRPPGPTTPAVVLVKSPDLSAQLRQYVQFCDTYAKPEYTVDCLSERVAFAAANMGAYDDAPGLRATLKATARRLGAIAAKYRATTTAPVTLQGGGAQGLTTSHPIRPVAPENLGPSNRAATAVLAEAELTLLRSATTTASLAFAQVAAVVGSAKVLLRAS